MPGAVVKYGENVGQEVKQEHISMMDGLKMTLGNKAFQAWLVVHGVFNLGLQMFLSGQNVLISGPMGLNGFQIALVNASAFAPVPVMLIFYRMVMKKKGFRFGFQTALAAFAVGMLLMAVAYVQWVPSQMVRMILAIAGGTVSSFGIGAFFSAPTAMPTQIAADQKRTTGVSHPSMYFAVQGLVTAVVGAFSTGLVWPNLRNITPGGNQVFGAHLMPYIAALGCVLAFFIAAKLPKMFDSFGKDQ